MSDVDDSRDRPEAVFTPRCRDRRLWFGELFNALSRSLVEHAHVSLMRGTFEEMLRRMIPVHSVHLRDARSRWSTRGESSDAVESVAFDVPGPFPSSGTLEATFAPGGRLGEWDFQMLGIAAHV